MASIVMFRRKVSATFHIVDDADDDCNSRSKIRNKCLVYTEARYQHICNTHQDSVTRECSQTLLTLLGEISPNLQHTLPAAMIGHIVLSTVWGRELAHAKEC